MKLSESFFIKFGVVLIVSSLPFLFVLFGKLVDYILNNYEAWGIYACLSVMIFLIASVAAFFSNEI